MAVLSSLLQNERPQVKEAPERSLYRLNLELASFQRGNSKLPLDLEGIFSTPERPFYKKSVRTELRASRLLVVHGAREGRLREILREADGNLQGLLERYPINVEFYRAKNTSVGFNLVVDGTHRTFLSLQQHIRDVPAIITYSVSPIKLEGFAFCSYEVLRVSLPGKNIFRYGDFNEVLRIRSIDQASLNRMWMVKDDLATEAHDLSKKEWVVSMFSDLVLFRGATFVLIDKGLSIVKE